MSTPGPPLPPAILARPVAHRGLWGAGRPENSLAAARAAVEAGYGIEADLQISADGRAMVFHDEALDRLTGEAGPLRARAAADLAAIPLRGGPEDAPERIPTLETFLEAIGGRVPLLLEIKDQDGALGPRVGALEAAAAEALASYQGPVAVMSFNPHAVAAMRDAAPRLARGLVTCAYPPGEWPQVPEVRRARLRAMATFDALGAAFVSHDARDLASPHLARIRRQGAAVLCWTIRSAKAGREARRSAHQITFEGFRPPLEPPAPRPT